MLSQLDRLRLLSSVFTRPAFASMARTDDYRAAFKGLLQVGVLEAGGRQKPTLGSVFDKAWSHLAEGYRTEYIYKNHLANKLIFGRHSPRTAGFQIELPVGRSIVDVAVANGTTSAYEIKTEYDSPKRLQSQTGDYLKAFDKVYLVTHPHHVERYKKELDSRVGLIALTKTGVMTLVRDAQSNKECVDPSTIFRCLRQAEYLEAIESMLGHVPALPNGLIRAHCEKIFGNFKPLEAHNILVKALRARTTDKNTVEFIEQLPSSLKALGYATPLSKRQREGVLNLLSQTVSLNLVL